jgi:hypothetical protein
MQYFWIERTFILNTFCISCYRYERPAMIYYMSVTGVFLVGLLALSSYIEKNEWLQDGLVQLLCYGGLGGTFGGQSVLFAKCTVELLKTAMLNPTVGAHAFKQWEPCKWQLDL